MRRDGDTEEGKFSGRFSMWIPPIHLYHASYFIYKKQLHIKGQRTLESLITD